MRRRQHFDESVQVARISTWIDMRQFHEDGRWCWAIMGDWEGTIRARSVKGLVRQHNKFCASL